MGVIINNATNGTPSIVTNGLVLHLDAANPRSYPRSGTTWTDLSGNGNNGTLTNGPTFNSGNGGSIVFDGVNDYSSFGGFNLSGQNITVNIWIYPTILNQFKTPITNQIFNGTTTGFAIQQRTNNTFWMVIGIWGVSSDGIQLIPFNINEWICLTMTYGNGIISAYKNGILFGSTSSTRIFVPGNLIIGAGQRGISEPFNGRISNCSIYNRALSEIEVQQNYNALKNRFGLE